MIVKIKPTEDEPVFNRVVLSELLRIHDVGRFPLGAGLRGAASLLEHLGQLVASARPELVETAIEHRNDLLFQLDFPA